jgi:hypothetical protein
MKLLRGFFRIYQVVISPAFEAGFGIRCRYEESCSRYAERVLREKGWRTGAGLALRRLLSCNNWSTHG